MSEKTIETYTSEELRAMRERGEDRTDWKRLAAMKDEDIDCTDIPALDSGFWDDAEVVEPEPKESISIRVDREVLDYFRNGGPGYQTRINAVLKSFVDVQRGKESTKQ